MLKLLFLLIFPILTVSSGIAQERKMQLWNYNSVSVQVWNKTSIEIVEKIHYSTEDANVNVKFGDVWLKHNPGKWFKYGAGFRMSYVRTVSGWSEERRPMLLGEFVQNYHNIKFDFSNRFEYRWFEQAQNMFRYRQKLDIDFPSVTPLKIKFFTSEEAFIKANSENLHLARFYAGINALNREHFHLKIYYSLEKSKTPEQWNTSDIMGVNMNLML